MNRKLDDWLRDGESLYEHALAECREIERQIGELEAKRSARRGEVEAIAQVLGHPASAPHGHDDSSRGANTVRPARVAVSASDAMNRAFVSGNGKH